jgi:hypothetical protein
LEPKITDLPHKIPFELGWRNHHANKFRSLSWAVSQSFPRAVKNPPGNSDHNYFKSTEKKKNKKRSLDSTVIPIFTAQKHSQDSYNFPEDREGKEGKDLGA